MKNFIKKYNIQLSILRILTIGLVILTAALYFLIPMILNYPAETYGTAFQTELENTVYWQQVVLIAFAIFLIFGVIIFTKTRFLIKYNDLIENPSKYSEKEINIVKEKLFNVPYSIFILNIIIPSIALTTIHAFTINQLSLTTLKMFMIVVSFVVLFVTAIFIYTNNLFKNILLKLPVTDISKIKRTSIRKRMVYHILPIIIASLLFITLLGYVKTAIEKGNSYFETYNKSLHYFCTYNNNEFSSLDDFIKNSNENFELINEKDLFFIRLPDGSFINRNKEEIEFSDFFIKYLTELSDKNDGRVYEYYGMDMQAATNKIIIENEEYLIGVYFDILSLDVLIYFLIAFVVLVIIDVIMLVLFSTSFKYDINAISGKFINMSENINSSETQGLVATTNDEIGDLCTSYNSIQQLTKDNQAMLIERERLASLGQMVGGIAHSLKTPIFSISGGIEGLSDLIKEFDESVEDPNVNDQDMHEIAKDMNVWIEKMKGHLSYMSEVITTVKGQAVNLSGDDSVNFTISEVFSHTNILMKHELQNALVKLETENNVADSVILTGNINSLVQVLNNLISNAIQAYNGKLDQKIELSANIKNNKIVIAIKDFGPGLPDKVKDKLFKEMITTKGKEGTGLGLFMSYSMIKAKFNGDITFETSKNGTTFYINLPV